MTVESHQAPGSLGEAGGVDHGLVLCNYFQSILYSLKTSLDRPPVSDSVSQSSNMHDAHYVMLDIRLKCIVILFM